MSIEHQIEFHATNRKKGKPPFYFDGVAYGLYQLSQRGYLTIQKYLEHQRVSKREKFLEMRDGEIESRI